MLVEVVPTSNPCIYTHKRQMRKARHTKPGLLALQGGWAVLWVPELSLPLLQTPAWQGLLQGLEDNRADTRGQEGKLRSVSWSLVFNTVSTLRGVMKSAPTALRWFSLTALPLFWRQNWIDSHTYAKPTLLRQWLGAHRGSLFLCPQAHKEQEALCFILHP